MAMCHGWKGGLHAIWGHATHCMAKSTAPIPVPAGQALQLWMTPAD
jgi:hypothetical protein